MRLVVTGCADTCPLYLSSGDRVGDITRKHVASLAMHLELEGRRVPGIVLRELYLSGIGSGSAHHPIIGATHPA